MAPTSDFLPTTTDKRSDRPTKKRALTPISQHSAQLEALFANPDRQIHIPSSTDLTKSNTSQTSGNGAPPAIVANVQGSSAGAGSGEFHVYKASRRREYERLRAMDEEVEKEKADEAFEARREEMRSRDEEQAARNRAKREKAKARQAKKKKGGAGAGAAGDVDGAGVEGGGKGVARKLGAAKVAMRRDGDDGEVKNGVVGDEGVATIMDGEDAGITFHDDD